VTEILNAVEPSPHPFSLAFSGKTNKKVNGLYKPDSSEIVLHNRNFESDDQLLYTALHEYAHHLHHHLGGGISRARPHTQEFWAIFHRLIEKAAGMGYYKNVFDTEPEFLALTRTIKETCIRANGEIMLEFGRLLAEASTLCERHRARFEDYIERVLGIPRMTAAAAVTASSAGLDPSLGWDSLRFVSSLRDPEDRSKALEILESGASPTSARGLLRTAAAPEDPSERLLSEKTRIERTIRNLTERLGEIERKLAEI